MQDAPAHTWITRDARHSLIALRAAGGRLVGALLAERPRELSALGARTINTALVMLTLMFAAVVGAIWLLLRRGVINRIVRLEHHLHAQSGDMAPMPADRSRDEIAQLTNAYNALVLRLAQATEAEQRAVIESISATAANKMKSDFLANISHELRTPLNSVIGYAELIEEDLAASGVPTASADLARITSAARQLLTLINEILDLSRIEAQRLEMRPEHFDVEEMLRAAIGSAQPFARAQASFVRLDCKGDLGSAYADQNRLRQCLVNVLVYACKRTHGGAVTVRALRNGADLRFEITDLGAPLNEAQTGALFEAFLREDDARATGARLSLAVTSKLMALLGGSVEVRSGALRGCTFVLTAPAVAPDAGQPEQAKMAAIAA